MNINIKTTNITLSEAISEYTSKRLQKIIKIIGDDTSMKCDVELGRTTDHHNKGEVFRAEIHLTGKGMNTYASAEKNDLYSAIDEVQEDVLRSVGTHKGKKISLIRRGGKQVKNILKGMWPGNWYQKSEDNE